MTGFGRSEIAAPGFRISVEIRSINNRFCEIGMKIPRELYALEAEIRDRIRARIERGKISLLITFSHENDEEAPFQLDMAKARACHSRLLDLNRELGNDASVTLGQLLHFSDYFTEASQIGLDEKTQAIVFSALNEALDNLTAMRQQEGSSLAVDLLSRQSRIEACLAKIEALAKNQPQLQLEKLRDRMGQLVAGGPLDPGRLEMELAFLTDRLDISEECVRLSSHGKLLREALSGRQSAGKKLGFILQEMQREANTISSKSALAEITHLAVEIKEEIEKMREQVQNLE